MAEGLDDYRQAHFDLALTEILKRMLVNPRLLPNVEAPRAFLLGGQSGSGKTTLHRLLANELEGNVIVINGDEYRRSHPNFTRIQERFGVDAPAHTAKWAGQMTEALIDALSGQGYNLVIEGTLRTSEVPLHTASLLRERGYKVSLAVMAVKPEVSLISCQIRYELMRLAGTTPRATDSAHHDKIVRQIVDNMAVLEQSGAFDSIRLFNRSGECLYPSGEQHGGNAPAASDALRETLFGNWTEEERGHYRFLQQKLEDVRGKASCGISRRRA